MNKAAIIVSSYNRSSLLRRTLYSIAQSKLSVSYEVILADDASTEDTLSVVREFSSAFHWKFINVDTKCWEKVTGIKKFFNNCSLTMNIAFRHISKDVNLIFQQGNEVIAVADTHNQLIKDSQESIDNGTPFLTFSTTYDMPAYVLSQLDSVGSNLSPNIIKFCSQFPLASANYKSDVTNYLSLCNRSLFEAIGGYDERYLGGIAKEDSDFVRRARATNDITVGYSTAISLHQDHGGMNLYRKPRPDVITMDRWNEGLEKTRSVYDAWNGMPQNPQVWPMGEYGVVDVVSNF